MIAERVHGLFVGVLELLLALGVDEVENVDVAVFGAADHLARLVVHAILQLIGAIHVSRVLVEHLAGLLVDQEETTVEHADEHALLVTRQRAARDRFAHVVAEHLAEANVVQTQALVQTRHEQLMLGHVDVRHAVAAVVDLLQVLVGARTHVPQLDLAVYAAAYDHIALVHVEANTIYTTYKRTKIVLQTILQNAKIDFICSCLIFFPNRCGCAICGVFELSSRQCKTRTCRPNPSRCASDRANNRHP